MNVLSIVGMCLCISVLLPARPLAQTLPESYLDSAEMDIQYGWVPFREGQLRSISYSPKNPAQPVPYVLLIPGDNCSSIAQYNYSYNGLFIRQLVQAGIGVFTVEKSGVGESHGCVPCLEVDLQTDIESFEAGYWQMRAQSHADTAKLYLFGHSMGGVIAPVIASKVNVAGVMVFATVFRPWSEFLLEMHRIQMPILGVSYEETEGYVRNMQKVYYEFFVNKKSPAEIAQVPGFEKTVISELDYKPGNATMWGRHWRFWQQLDSLNLTQHWGKVNCPVLSVFGGADYIACSPLEHKLLTAVVNDAHPGNATHVTIVDIDHLMVRNPDRKTSAKYIKDRTYARDNYHTGLANTIIQWLSER